MVKGGGVEGDGDTHEADGGEQGQHFGVEFEHF